MSENLPDLDLLDDEADSQDAELVARLAQAAVQPTHKECQSFRDYLRQRKTLSLFHIHLR